MIKNQELASQIFETMNIAIEASEEMLKFLENNQLNNFQIVFKDLFLMMKTVRGIADNLKKEEDGLNLPAASESVLISLSRLNQIALTDRTKAKHKVEFELIPLIEEMRVSFYYWGMVYPDADKIKKYYAEDIFWLTDNKYISKSEIKGKYKYDLSIIVLAYNKLEYTKVCLNSLYKNLPEDITYEIILVNHGSTDETKTVFESFNPDKQVDIAVNGGGLGVMHRITEGKYTLLISNDVVLTPNAIQNLFKCISSDESIAWAVPTTPNVSNLQSIDAKYNNFEELSEFAMRNNISNPNRWEQRVRLCNPIDICRSSVLNQLKPAYHYQSKNAFSFPDDKMSLLCRRSGYKIYLVKDAYCHHFGSVTLGKETSSNTENIYENGRKDFYKLFGVDPWGIGFCYSYDLFANFQYIKEGKVSILGLNCGLGSNPLKIKELLKEKVQNEDVYLENITTKENVLDDLRGISDEAKYISDFHEIKKYNKKYDYIVVEDVFYESKQMSNDFAFFLDCCNEKGIVFIALYNAELDKVKKELKNVKNCNEYGLKNGERNITWLVLCR